MVKYFVDSFNFYTSQLCIMYAVFCSQSGFPGTAPFNFKTNSQW